MIPEQHPDRLPRRLRHPLKARHVQVARTTMLSPRMVRITLTGEDLDEFVTASFDDHVKVFFPQPGEIKPVLPVLGPNGPAFPEGVRPVARDYTPRAYRPQDRELDLEFILHGSGPACTWAAQAQPGQYLGIAGPRGSFVIPDCYDWYVLFGDQTALPAIARFLEELPSGRQAEAFIHIDDASETIELPTRSRIHVNWLVGREAELDRAAHTANLPPGEGYLWAAGESAAIKAVRAVLTGERGIERTRIRAASYWRRGASAVHETFDD